MAFMNSPVLCGEMLFKWDLECYDCDCHHIKIFSGFLVMTAIYTKYVGGSSGYWGAKPSLFNTCLPISFKAQVLAPSSSHVKQVFEIASTRGLAGPGELAGSRMWLLSPGDLRLQQLGLPPVLPKVPGLCQDFRRI